MVSCQTLRMIKGRTARTNSKQDTQRSHNRYQPLLAVESMDFRGGFARDLFCLSAARRRRKQILLFPPPASYSWTGHANENCNLFLLNIIECEGGDLCKFVVNSLSLNIILRLVEGRFVLLVQNL